MNKIYIIIVNYNNWQDTIECLESVLKNDYKNFQIIVVDNMSQNDSMKKIEQWLTGEQEVLISDTSKFIHLYKPFKSKPLDYISYSRDDIYNIKDKKDTLSKSIILIQSGKNDGFSDGNNLGINYAISKNDFEFIWLLNADTVIEKNALTSLSSYSKENDIGISGSKLVYYDTNTIQAYGGHINKFFGVAQDIKEKEHIAKKLDYIVGASFLINKKVIDKIGLLPTNYFLYFEETDYCFNARKNGFKIGVDKESIVYHKVGSTTKDKISKKDNEFIELLKLKNRIYFHKKYLGGGLGLYLGFFLVIVNRIRRKQFLLIPKILKLF